MKNSKRIKNNCGMCEFEREQGLDYCSRCSYPLSDDAMRLEGKGKQSLQEFVEGLVKYG